ncbi:MAG: glycosyltransferase family 9 protein [Saonia sp.]
MKILIIQQKMIGDVLISSILCENIKKNLPDSEVHYLINNHTEAVVVNNPYIDRIVYFKAEYKKNRLAFYAFLKGIRKEKYQAVIDVYGKLESNLVSLFSKAPIKVSHKKWYTNFVYTHHITKQKKRDMGVGYAIEDRLLFLAPIIPTLEETVKKPVIYLTDQEIAGAKKFLESHSIDFAKPILMLSILGSGKNKTYPLPYMAEVIDHIAEKTDATLLFNYIPSQYVEAKELYDRCAIGTKKHIKFDAFAKSLRSFLALLHHCDAIIGNEGGAINMAKALDIPTFSIFSPWITKLAWDIFSDQNNVAVHLNDFMPEKIQGKSKKELKQESLELYPLFTPSLLLDKLEGFLANKVLANQ